MPFSNTRVRGRLLVLCDQNFFFTVTGRSKIFFAKMDRVFVRPGIHGWMFTFSKYCELVMVNHPPGVVTEGYDSVGWNKSGKLSKCHVFQNFGDWRETNSKLFANRSSSIEFQKNGLEVCEKLLKAIFFSFLQQPIKKNSLILRKWTYIDPDLMTWIFGFELKDWVLWTYELGLCILGHTSESEYLND